MLFFFFKFFIIGRSELLLVRIGIFLLMFVNVMLVDGKLFWLRCNFKVTFYVYMLNVCLLVCCCFMVEVSCLKYKYILLKYIILLIVIFLL